MDGDCPRAPSDEWPFDWLLPATAAVADYRGVSFQLAEGGYQSSLVVTQESASAEQQFASALRDCRGRRRSRAGQGPATPRPWIKGSCRGQNRRPTEKGSLPFFIRGTALPSVGPPSGSLQTAQPPRPGQDAPRAAESAEIDIPSGSQCYGRGQN